MRLAVLSLVCVSAFAGQSATGGSSWLPLPNSAPWSTALAADKNYRLELRINGITGLSGYVAGIGPYQLWTNNVDQLFLTEAWNGADGQGPAVTGLTGKTDLLIRVQRNGPASTASLEVCGTATGTCSVSTTSITLATNPWLAGNFYMPSGSNGTLAFLRWYNTLVAVGTRITPWLTGSPEYGNWEFEGNITDAGPYALTGIWTGTVTYSTTPVYAPACNAGAVQAFRAGALGSPTAAASYPLDGGSTLTYFWQQLAGPTTLSWSSHTTVAPSVSRMVFGQYDLRLTVTDGSAQSATCTVAHGAVATDSNGVVVVSNADHNTLLGPLTRLGTSPWAYFDERHKALADLFGGLQATDYVSVWDTPLAGTITVTNGSAVVTGSGTALQTDFCNGGSSPYQNAQMVIWYTVPPPYSGTYGRRLYEVKSCDSQVQITLGRLYETTTNQSGVSYSRMYETEAATWYNGSTNANYYDNVVAFYALYYRTGLTAYLTYARTMADRWWTMPLIDEGRPVILGGGNSGSAPRIRGYTGLLMRALDGRPEMLDGLRLWWTDDKYYVSILSIVGDLREDVLRLYNVSLCALYNPNGTEKAACLAVLNAALSVWEGLQKVGGNWIVNSSGPASWNGYSGTATVINGSTTVTGVGTSWTTAVVPDSPYYGLWITNGAADKVNGDAAWYHPHRVNDTEVTLDRPYGGANGTLKGWQFGQGVGWGTQPFMQGVAGTVMHFAYLATSDARARQFVLDSADWMKNVGYRSSFKGIYYYREFLNCEPNPELNTACTGDGGTEAENRLASRAYTGEIHRNNAFAYLHDPTGPALTQGDLWFSAAYSKYAGEPGYDTYYVSELEGWTVSTKKAKDFGFHFGFGQGASWLAARLGGLAAPDPRTLTVGVKLSSVPNATKYRVTMTSPAGAAVAVTCTSSPCFVAGDARQGSHFALIEYLSAGDAVLARSSEKLLVTVQ